MADDLKNVIKNWRNHLKAIPQQGITAIDAATLHRFLDAADAGMRSASFTVEEVKTLTDDAERHARDAALEEAAGIIEDSRGEVEDDDNGRSAAVDEHCRFLIARVRALRRPA